MASKADDAPVIYLYHEGDTELDYVQQLAKGKDIRIIKRPSVSSPHVLVQRAREYAVEQAKYLLSHPNAEIWVIFDFDSKAQAMEKVRKLRRSCPEGCKGEKNCGRDFNRCPKAEVFKRIHVAFMSPCIELWGLMCTEQGATQKKFSEDRHKLQSQLAEAMPNYAHNGSPRFDLSCMTQTAAAIRRAKGWVKTHGEFPDCLTAPHYAGIGLLVEKILTARNLNVKDWRRRR